MREDNAVCAIITMQLPRFPDSPRLPGKMSMLIADRFVNSPCRPPRSLCLTASGLSVPLPPPPRTTFNYPSMHRAIVDVANIKDLAPTMYGTRCPRSLARDSTSTIDSVIVGSTRQRSRTWRDSLLSCLSSAPIAPARTAPAWYLIRPALSDWFRHRGLAHRDKRDKPGVEGVKCRGTEIKVGKWAHFAMYFKSGCISDHN